MVTSLIQSQTIAVEDSPRQGVFDTLSEASSANLTCDIFLRQRVMELYGELHPALLAHLRALGLSTEDAEDVIHETFLRLVRHLLKMRTDENVRGWLFRVAYNLSMDVHRSHKHYRSASSEEMEDALLNRREAVDSAPSPEAVLIEKETLDNLQTAVMQLTLQQRKCLLLRAEGLRYREIASTMGISVQRAARLLQRGTSHIAAKL